MNKLKNKVGRPKLKINEQDLERELKKYIERKTNGNYYFSKFENWKNFILSDFERSQDGFGTRRNWSSKSRQNAGLSGQGTDSGY